jgi:hypothetical protein
LQPDRDEVVASLNVVELLKRHHYSKPPLDDARSVIIYDSYIKLLDPSRSYFMASDIAEFDKWKTQFDDFLKSGDLNAGFTIYKRYLDRVKARLDFALAELNKGVDKIDFTTKETLLIDRKDAPWLKSTAELDDLWRKRVKDEVLRQKIAGKDPKQIQETLTKRYKNQLARLDQTRAEDIFQAYINTFAMSYDPHTNYLSPDNAENFDINMSLSLEGIGAVLQSDNDQVKIVRLVPAGRRTRPNRWPGRQDHRRCPGQQRDGRRGRLAPGRSGQADPRPERHRGAPGSDSGQQCAERPDQQDRADHPRSGEARRPGGEKVGPQPETGWQGLQARRHRDPGLLPGLQGVPCR